MNEVVAALDVLPAETLVDLTAGLGGHSAAVVDGLAAAAAGGDRPRIVLSDADAGNLKCAAARLADADPLVRHGNFDGVPAWLLERGIAADAVLADLGFASNQVDDPSRGLSFRSTGPLDMRLDRTSDVTAASLIAESGEEELARIIHEYGEDRLALRIARRIIERRDAKPIITTGQLADAVRSAYPGRQRHARGKGQIDPATRTFQAIRIAVNDEIGSLERLLAAIESGAKVAASGEPSWLRPGARIGIISFHSLEDRPVKRSFRALCNAGLAAGIGAGVRGRKVIIAGDAERAANPRARSAKLRVIRLAGS